MRNSSWCLAAACVTAVFTCSACGPLYATRTQSQLAAPHVESTRGAYTGYEPGAVRTVGPHTTLAEYVTRQRVHVDAQPASTEFFLPRSCEVKTGLDLYRLPAGELKDSIVIPGSPRLVLAPLDISYPDHRYVAVRPDGTITNRLWIGNGVTGLEVGHVTRDLVWHIQLIPATCRFEARSVPPIPARDEVRETVQSRVTYLGGAPSFLDFGEVTKEGVFAEHSLPAIPGEYYYAGLKIRVIQISGDRVTLSIQ